MKEIDNKIDSIDDLENNKEDLVNYFNVRKRNPVIYITPLSELYNKKELLKYENIYNDSWLYLENTNNYPKYKSKLSLEINKVVDRHEEFIDAVSNGFSSDDPLEPYEGLTEEYKIVLRESITNKNILHFMALYNNKIVGTLTAVIKNEIACIYNVTTNKNYKKNGICKELISYVVNELNKLNIKQVCLQTEVGFYTEQIYLNLGFKKIFDASAYVIK